MELKTIEDEKNKFVFELEGEAHTFCNAIAKELWEDDHVKISAYTIDHPLVGVPRFIVETDGKETPQKALSEAVKRLKKRAEEFKSGFKK